MSKKEDFTSKPLSYYVEKFQRRVFRRLVEYQVLRGNLERELPNVQTDVIDLLGIDAELVANFKTKDHIEKACLTGLKAEFELFFTIYCTLVVDRQLRLIEERREVSEDMHKLLKKTKDNFFDPFVKAGFRDARQIFRDQLIPKHGLGLLAKRIGECGWDIVDHLDTRDGNPLDKQFSGLIDTPWAQINMGFQVRHAIEHTFSRVGGDGRFLFHTTENRGGCLRQSTWRRWWSAPPQQPGLATELGLGSSPRIGDRVLIDETDIRGTAAAMSWAANKILAHWNERTAMDDPEAPSPIS